MDQQQGKAKGTRGDQQQGNAKGSKGDQQQGNANGARVLALVVVAIIAALAVFAGDRIHSMEREILEQKGELIAEESAMEFDHYLLTRMNLLSHAGYTVNEMQAAGADNKDILNYIIEDTDYFLDAFKTETTGLYGWINGKYMDGTRWVPDDDFVPVERPWYKAAMRTEDEICFVAPYLDAQTGGVMMTIAEKLNDGVSVIGLDINMDYIQRRVEEIAASTEGSRALILDTDGVVVAHSDKSQVGSNYLIEGSSLGKVMAEKLLKDGEMQFELSTDEGNYSLYAEKLQGGWYSVSLINNDIWHRPMHRTMIMFAVILTVVLLLFVFFFLRLASSNQTLMRLYMEIKQAEKRGDAFKALSETDRMTGLYDHVSGEARVNGIGSGGMFLALDIDHFKSINDTYGHQAGDEVIIAVADALRHTFSANDVTMRLGGDEFGVFAVGIKEKEAGRAIIRRLFDRIEKLEIPQLKGNKIYVSVGAAFCREPESFDTLYEKADMALYESKKRDGNYVEFCESDESGESGESSESEDVKFSESGENEEE